MTSIRTMHRFVPCLLRTYSVYNRGITGRTGYGVVTEIVWRWHGDGMESLWNEFRQRII